MLSTEEIQRALAALPPEELDRVAHMVQRGQFNETELRRKAMVVKARDDLVTYAKYTMPDLRKKADPLATRYKPARHHLALGQAFHKVEAGEWPFLIIVMPPRHGKTELASKRGVSWFAGRDPYRQIIFATYNDELAGDMGRAIRDIMRSEQHHDVFPDFALASGSQSVGRLMTTWGGAVMCVGRGGAITGRGADMAIIDDPIKGREEAEQRITRDKLWDWFNDDIYSRLIDENCRIVLIQTRWHEDDLVGRLTDPQNPCYREEEAKKWRILELPAIAGDDDPLGREPGVALWPERFSAEYLRGIQIRNPRGFASLYQGRPSPEDGDFFRAKWLKEYRSMRELPENLRWFGASDHAVGTKQTNDRSCLGLGGVDDAGDLWISPELEWGRFPTDQTVEKLLALIRKRRPITWWAEAEHISKSIGPFLRRRMRDTNTYCSVEDAPSAKDKAVKAQAFRGMCAIGIVHFPSFAPWWPEARAELLKFPNATHDDFVDFCGHLGRGVDRMFGSHRRTKGSIEQVAERRTFGWLKRLSDEQARGPRTAHGGF